MTEDTFLTLRQAAKWASQYLGKEVTESNISYLIQYGKITKYLNSGTKISLQELVQYYEETSKNKQEWFNELSEDINWTLAFDGLKESERTKHVHRLHPYKGKFIPQLVRYFLDNQTDTFKKEAYFSPGDIIIDPFVGSGTTLVECKELGMHSIGIDISKFNCMICSVKTNKYDLDEVYHILNHSLRLTEYYVKEKFNDSYHDALKNEISKINSKYFPSPFFKRLIYKIDNYERNILKDMDLDRYDENRYENMKNEIKSDINKLFQNKNICFNFKIDENQRLLNRFTEAYSGAALNELYDNMKGVEILAQTKLTTDEYDGVDDFLKKSELDFIPKWFTNRQIKEINYYLMLIENEKNEKIKDLMRIILSRTVRSCRATKHVDLATLIEPQYEPYYCRKHYKICAPIHTIIKHLKRYTKDTIKRLRKYDKLQKNVECEVINADSRTINLFDYLKINNRTLYSIVKNKKIDGIFTSPPYLGMIDYHEQHAYSYELYDIERKDELEIGRKSNGKSQDAKNDYIDGITDVLINLKQFLKTDANIFFVANDSENLYPTIIERSGLEFVDEFKRPVLNRTERDKQPYSESIFHMRNS